MSATILFEVERCGCADMRVIAGSAKSLQLNTVKGMDTRPTTDRIKETLFNIIQNDILDCSFLDLYSGSGAIGIEALSRGAKIATFVENNSEAIKCIKDNLIFTKLSDKGEVLEMNVEIALSKLEMRSITYDVIFMDPPYGKEYEKETLKKLSNMKIIDKDTLIIIEADLKTDFSYLNEMGYFMIKEKLYKTNKHIFVQKV